MERYGSLFEPYRSLFERYGSLFERYGLLFERYGSLFRTISAKPVPQKGPHGIHMRMLGLGGRTVTADDITKKVFFDVAVDGQIAGRIVQTST